MWFYPVHKCSDKWLIPTVVILTTVVSSAEAQNSTTVQSENNLVYTVFHPVPKQKMQEMETDRPDVTESAFTVAPGHFQVESDLVRYVRNKSTKTINTTVNYNVGNYKLGLSKRTDIQLIIPAYVKNSIRDRSRRKITAQTAGIDDITLRFKYNIRGYSGGKTALAALPFISFPTSSFTHNGIQGGIVFPFAWQISEGLDFGSQVEIDAVKEDDNYHCNFLYTATCGKEIFSRVSAFVEGVAAFNSYYNNTDVYANGGIIFSLSPDFNIDAGINYGLSNNSDHIFFTGFSIRL